MNEWTSVKDRRPEIETPVLAIVKGEIRIAERVLHYPNYHDSIPEFDYWDCPFDDGQDWDYGDVTHWMPLPNPPEESKDE
jgi:hypothetical protein